MNTSELVDAVAGEVSVTKKNADVIVTAIVESIMEAVSTRTEICCWRFP